MGALVDCKAVIRSAHESDVPDILRLIRALAEYEKLSHEVVADEATLRESLFGKKRYAEVLLAEVDGQVAGFCLFFHNFSTFLGRPGIYIEDIFVLPEFRARGIGKQIALTLANSGAAIAIAGYWLAGFATALWLGLYTPLAGVGVWTGLLVGLVAVAVLLGWRWHRRAALGLLPG